MEPESAIFAAIARLLVATEGSCRVPGTVVDFDTARAQTLGDSQRFFPLAALNISGQTIFCVICHFHCVIDRLVWQDRQNWAEDFFARNCHRWINIGEHCWAYVIATVEIGWQAGSATDAHGDIEVAARKTSETFTNYLVRNRSGRYIAIRVMVNRAGGAGVKPLVFFVDYVLKPHAFDGVFQTNAQYGETYYLEWAVYDPVSPETNEARLPRAHAR